MGWLVDILKVFDDLLRPLIAYVVGHRKSASLERKNITDAAGIAAAISGAITSENKHIELRFQWNLGLQGFLFASYAIAIGQSASAANKQIIKGFADTIATVGMLSCGITVFGLYAAYRAINEQKMIWLSNEEELNKNSSAPFSEIWPSFIGRIPSIGITLTILWAWTRLDSLI
jgi:hypothetical protein